MFAYKIKFSVILMYSSYLQLLIVKPGMWQLYRPAHAWFLILLLSRKSVAVCVCVCMHVCGCVGVYALMHACVRVCKAAIVSIISGYGLRIEVCHKN